MGNSLEGLDNVIITWMPCNYYMLFVCRGILPYL